MSFERPRELTDPKAMRALAHPVRLALLEALAEAEPLTATEAGERIGESPANASFHLRQLAKYGFVEEAEAGKGRRRPWRLKQLGMSWSDVDPDPDRASAAQELSRIALDRYLGRAQRQLSERHALPDEWREVSGISQSRLWLTAAELKQLEEEFLELLLGRFADRRRPSPDQPDDAKAVEILTVAYRL
jgi:DNA-binding transcriptional ArsR family regulator